MAEIEFTDEYEEGAEDFHRYLFTVRQRFGVEPELDSFYELQVPSGTTSAHAKIMGRLTDYEWQKDAIKSDTSALKGMEMRLRFNSDMYQRVCLVTTVCEIDRETLETIIQAKHKEGILVKFLDENAVK